MQFKATSQLTGLDQFTTKLRQIQEAKTAKLERVGAMQVAAVQERIRSSKTDPNGRPWQPWSMATMKQRAREGNMGRGLLYRTGALINSIKYKVEDGKLHVWSDAPYAQFLNFGTPKMPARTFMGLGDQIDKINNTIKEGIK